MKRCKLLGILVVLAGGLFATGALKAEPQPIPAERFDTLQQMIQPQPGENRFWEIRWLTDLWEARQTAAREGKPIFIWAGSQGAPITGC